MHPASQLRLYLLELKLKLLAYRFATDRKPSLSCYSTDVGKPQKVECIWFTFAATGSVLGCETSEFNKTCFVPMQGQTKSGKPLFKLSKEPLCFAAMLEPYNKVIGKAHDNYVTLSVPVSPLLCPQIEYIVQIDVGEQWAYTAALHCACIELRSSSFLQHTSFQPF